MGNHKLYGSKLLFFDTNGNTDITKASAVAPHNHLIVRLLNIKKILVSISNFIT